VVVFITNFVYTARFDCFRGLTETRAMQVESTSGGTDHHSLSLAERLKSMTQLCTKQIKQF
jgi:hypothetical protein